MEQPSMESKFAEFGPDRQFLIKNYLYAFLSSLIFIGPITGLSFFLEEGLLALTIPVIIILFMLITKLYYDSLNYQITSSEIVIKLGIFFKKEVIIPLRTITNIDTFKGPVDRIFGIASVNIQTAGRATLIAEGRFVGLLNDDAQALTTYLKQKLQMVQGGDGTAIEGSTTYTPVDEVLYELRAIKQVLIDIRDANVSK